MFLTSYSALCFSQGDSHCNNSIFEFQTKLQIHKGLNKFYPNLKLTRGTHLSLPALSFLCSTELGMGGGVLPKLLHPVRWPSENLAVSPSRQRRRQVVHALFPSSPSALPSSSLALTLFFLCSPRLSSSSSLFRPQIASFLL